LTLTTLNRRTALAALTALPFAGLATSALAQLAPADQALADQAVAYLDGLKEAQGKFVQTDARGATTQGRIFIKRPGKARFEYAAPSGLLVVSDGLNVTLFDARLKTFDRQLLKATPLNLFLARRVRLDGGVKVTKVSRLSDGFSITAEDVRRETRGRITMNFASSPVSLIGWTITDARGASTRVRLIDFRPASGLDPSLFVLRDPRPQSSPSR
jgi:outer membrane lipoprotein-sorting protein